MLTINLCCIFFLILTLKSSLRTRLPGLREPRELGGERWGWYRAWQWLLCRRRFDPLKYLLESASIFSQLSFSLLPSNVAWISSKCPLPWQHLQVKALLLAASLASDEEATNHCMRGMQSPRHPWTICVRGCPWSTLFSQVFNLFSRIPGKGKANKDSFSVVCISSLTSPRLMHYLNSYEQPEGIKVISAACQRVPTVERELSACSPPDSSKPTRIWGQLQCCPLDAKWPWPGPRCLTSLPSGPLPIIPHFWKDSYSEIFSVTSPPLLIHAVHKKQNPMHFCLTLTAFQFRLLKHFMNPVWVPSTAFLPLLPMDKQAGIRESRIWPNVCFKWVNTKARKSPEEPWRAEVLTTHSPSLSLLVIISIDLYIPWQVKETTCGTAALLPVETCCKVYRVI